MPWDECLRVRVGMRLSADISSSVLVVVVSLAHRVLMNVLRWNFEVMAVLNVRLTCTTAPLAEPHRCSCDFSVVGVAIAAGDALILRLFCSSCVLC